MISVLGSEKLSLIEVEAFLAGCPILCSLIAKGGMALRACRWRLGMNPTLRKKKRRMGHPALARTAAAVPPARTERQRAGAHRRRHERHRGRDAHATGQKRAVRATPATGLKTVGGNMEIANTAIPTFPPTRLLLLLKN